MPSARSSGAEVPSSAQSPLLPQSPPQSPLRRHARKAVDPVSLGLRKLWEHVEKEPVPDAMLALLDAIDAVRDQQTTAEGTAEKDGTPPRPGPGGAA